MDDCRRFERSMQQLLGEEIGPEEHGRLLRHAEGCPDCERMLAIHLDLSDPALALTQEDEEGLLGVRRAVLREIRHREADRGASRWAWRPGPAWRPALAAGIGAALLAAGFLAGSRTAPQRPGGAALVREIDRQAATHASLRDTANSPYLYRNVRLRDAGDGRVALGFEVATHVNLVRPKDDPLVAEVLVQAMLEGEALGARLRAVSQTSGFRDPRIQEALVTSMLFDPSLPVRLRALSRLAEGPAAAPVRDAMLQVVASEESVQMRLLAIDYLTKNQVPREDLARAIDSGSPGQRFAAYARAEPYLEQR